MQIITGRSRLGTLSIEGKDMQHARATILVHVPRLTSLRLRMLDLDPGCNENAVLDARDSTRRGASPIPSAYQDDLTVRGGYQTLFSSNWVLD